MFFKVNFPLYLLFWLLPLSPLSIGTNDDPRCSRLVHQMLDSISKINTLRIKISALERIERKFVTARSEVKLQSKPRKLYFVNPQKKLEILYDSELSSEKALVKPHVFPYLTISIDTRGHLMRRNQHYTVHELGFDFIGRSVLLTLHKDREGINNFRYLGRHAKNGYDCHLLEYDNRSYGYTDYTVGEKETATSIAYKLCVHDYLLRYKNGLLNDFGYIRKGTVLKVPTLYCQKAVIYIDDKMMLPVSLSLYDDTGLFESYDFTDIRVNQPINQQEFSRGYHAYGF